MGRDVAQFVQRWTEKPGAILTEVRLLDSARDLSAKVSFQCRPSYGVHAAPFVHQSAVHCTHVKNPKHWPAVLL